jgi:hypothetical protein
MKKIVVFLALICLLQTLFAQQPYIYTIKADSVKITNTCDTAELIIENHTQNVPGFLFNKGKGRTEFRRGLLKITDSLYIVGGDTLRMNPWLQGGNRFGTTGSFGTMDNNHIDFYTNGLQRGRWTNTGNFHLGSVSGYDYTGYKMRIIDNGSSINFVPKLSRSQDMINIGGYINNDDGQNMLISTSNGTSSYAVLMERDGFIGMGWGSPYGWNVGRPTFRIHQNGTVSVASQSFHFGNTGGPYNCSALIMSVSNGNEWRDGWEYPNGQNSYYFGTILQTPTGSNSRAPLVIGAKTLNFHSGATNVEAVRITDAQNVLIGTTSDNGNKLQVTGNANVTGNLAVSGNTINFAGLSVNNSAPRILASDGNGNLFFREASSLAFNNNIPSDLAVNGRVSAQKMLITQTGRWPDYVFSKQYHLPSLTEVENFIKQNNHLPGIPSATEVEKKGIDVGDNQAALLKKIEELTLYVIEQNKKIQKQNEEMNELKRLNSDMESLKQQLNELRILINNKETSGNNK